MWRGVPKILTTLRELKLFSNVHSMIFRKLCMSLIWHFILPNLLLWFDYHYLFMFLKIDLMYVPKKVPKRLMYFKIDAEMRITCVTNMNSHIFIKESVPMCFHERNRWNFQKILRVMRRDVTGSNLTCARVFLLQDRT